MMVADLGYDAYREEVVRKAAEPVDGLTSSPAGKYRIGELGSGSQIVEPVDYPGCTILAKPYPLDVLAEPLATLQGALSVRSVGFASVPVETLHVTVADLIAGRPYTDLRENGLATLIHERARDVVAAHAFRRRVAATICGVGAFNGVVIAIVDFESVTDYGEILRLRDAVYAERELQWVGVARRFPFLGHVTLGYVEAPAPNGIAPAIAESRAMHSRIPFTLDAAAVFVFANMSSFHNVSA